MYNHPWHNVLSSIFEQLRGGFLADQGCYFGGGTALVLQSVSQKWRFGEEYRLSRDIDFLCTQPAFAKLRRIVAEEGITKLTGDLKFAREVRLSDRAIRTSVIAPATGEAVKFEIVCDGYFNTHLPGEVVHSITCLDLANSVAQKLTANSDRWADRDIALRDYIDLIAISSSPKSSFSKGLAMANEAYGEHSIREGLFSAHSLLRDNGNLDRFSAHLKLSSKAKEHLREVCNWEPSELINILVSGPTFDDSPESIY